MHSNKNLIHSKEAIKAAILSLGFDSCAIVEPNILEEDRLFFTDYLREGKQAGMEYLEKNIDKRCDPRLLLPDCESIIILLLYYGHSKDTEVNKSISKYAQGKDYHRVFKRKMKMLQGSLAEMQGDLICRNFVDTAPIFEKRWAEKAGLGYIGKNTLLINPELGSYCFIGVVLSNLRFDTYDKSLAKGNHPCSDCDKCVKACPTNALNNGLDARKCLSYLSIEHNGDINSKTVELLKNKWFGCDICQDVCPINKEKDIQTKHLDFFPMEDVLGLTKESLSAFTEDSFTERFSKTSLKRAGLKKLRRNTK